mmetsp:Transcript_30398/g.97989  ORF Transcript_30398/g.97989 Transcript_30398/m.97989 type:complete len:206 (-) Transcript_30398:132-749(-)
MEALEDDGHVDLLSENRLRETEEHVLRPRIRSRPVHDGTREHSRLSVRRAVRVVRVVQKAQDGLRRAAVDVEGRDLLLFRRLGKQLRLLRQRRRRRETLLFSLLGQSRVALPSALELRRAHALRRRRDVLRARRRDGVIQARGLLESPGQRRIVPLPLAGLAHVTEFRQVPRHGVPEDRHHKRPPRSQANRRRLLLGPDRQRRRR